MKDEKTLQELSDRQFAVTQNIKKVKNYLENEDVNNKEMFEELLKEYFEVQENNKDFIKQKVNSICYLLKKFESEIDLDKSILENLKSRIKAK